MTTHRIHYEGPPALAVNTATTLAEADGVELVSSEPPRRTDSGSDTVVLELTVEGTDADVADAVRRIRDLLPRGASIESETQGP